MKFKNFLMAFFKFSPVFLLAGLMIAGYDALIAAPIAAIFAFAVAGIVGKIKFQDSLDAADEKRKQHTDCSLHPHVRLTPWPVCL